MTTSDLARPPAAEGKRLPWSAVPDHLQAEAERLLGGRVLHAVTQPGGFSPGVAARLVLGDGRRAFVKAVGDLNPDSPGIHRAEARIAAALPETTPAPRMLGSLDADGWVILLFEDVNGSNPAQPWQPDQLARVLSAMADLAVALTPAPIEAPPAASRFSNLGRGWQQLADAAASGAAVSGAAVSGAAVSGAAVSGAAVSGAALSGQDDLAGLDPWAHEHLADLVALEQRWDTAVEGSCLAHGDVRADNILLTPDQVVFVDWPWACLAQPWFDLAGMLPSVALHGGPAPEDLFAAHPVARGADPDKVTAVVAALAGMWTFIGRLPDPPGLPTVRAFQRAQGTIALRWLKRRI